MKYKPEGLEVKPLRSASHFCRRIESGGIFVFELYIFRNLAVNFNSNLPFVKNHAVPLKATTKKSLKEIRNYFIVLTFRTGEEKKVFVNAIKEAKKISKFSNSIPVLGKSSNTLKSSLDGRRSNNGKEGPPKPTIKKKPSFGKRDTEKKHGIFGN